MFESEAENMLMSLVVITERNEEIKNHFGRQIVNACLEILALRERKLKKLGINGETMAGLVRLVMEISGGRIELDLNGIMGERIRRRTSSA
jgi:hypothetical protein